MLTKIRWAFEQRWAHLVPDEAHWTRCNGITVEGTTMIRLILTSHHISKCFLKTGCSKKKKNIFIIFHIISVQFNFHIIRFQSLGKGPAFLFVYLFYFKFYCIIPTVSGAGYRFHLNLTGCKLVSSWLLNSGTAAHTLQPEETLWYYIYIKSLITQIST